MTSATMRDGQLRGSGVLPNLYEDDELSCAFRFMFGEGGAKRQISGIVFGGGLALFAAQFLVWLF